MFFFFLLLFEHRVDRNCKEKTTITHIDIKYVPLTLYIFRFCTPSLQNLLFTFSPEKRFTVKRGPRDAVTLYLQRIVSCSATGVTWPRAYLSNCEHASAAVIRAYMATVFDIFSGVFVSTVRGLRDDILRGLVGGPNPKSHAHQRRNPPKPHLIPPRPAHRAPSTRF